MKPKKDFSKPEDKRIEKQVFAKKIGDHLRKIRTEKGISQERLSLNAGYYHTYVNKIETGKYSPSLHTIWRLSHQLGISLSQFFRSF